jgi:hypothetical protein
MADQINHPNRPATDYERQQARLIAEFNAKQDSKEQLATDLKSQFSETFERSADIALDRLGNEYNRELAVDNIASILAENNIPRPDLMGVIVDSSRNPTLSRCQRPVAPTDFVVLPLGKGCLGQVRGMKNILLDGPRRADAAPLGNQNPFAEQGRRKL